MGVLRADEIQSRQTGPATDAEPGTFRSSDKNTGVNVVTFNGEFLLQGVVLSDSDKLQHLRELANEQFQKKSGHDASEVSALVSANGQRLCDSTLVKDSGLIKGSIVTAIVTAIDELKELEGLFHELMKARHQTFVPSHVSLGPLPSLKDHFEQKGNGGAEYYDLTFGMYGGFDATLSKNETATPGSQWELSCKLWSCHCERYGEALKITRKRGIEAIGDDVIC